MTIVFDWSLIEQRQSTAFCSDRWPMDDIPLSRMRPAIVGAAFSLKR